MGSTPAAPNGEVLTIDANGDVILVRDSIGSGGIAATNLGNYCSDTDNPLTGNYEIPLNSHNFYFSGQGSYTDEVGIGLPCDSTLEAKLHIYQEHLSEVWPFSAPNNSVAGLFHDNAPSGSVIGVGVKGLSYGSAGVNAGGWFQAAGSTSANYGIFAAAGTAMGGGPDYAGYFTGDTYTTGTNYTSDEHLKEDIQPIVDATSTLNLLSPVAYRYRFEEYPTMRLPQEPHMGLIAQEVEQVLPVLSILPCNPKKVKIHP